jgi:FAD:protein FMN transferase
MATRFEIVLHGEDHVHLRAAGEEALDEIERLEAQLSLYRNNSEISRINFRAAAEAVPVEPSLFRLFEQARRLSAETHGAFDITVAPLMRCWGFMQGKGAVPTPAQLEEARASVGMRLVELDERKFTIRFAREGVMLDLGSIGKGYALERAAQFVRESGVTSALLQGGTSTICAIGSPPDADAWKIAIEGPVNETSSRQESTRLDKGQRERMEKQGDLLAVVPLRDTALSVSAVWGKSFTAGAKTYGHVIDPRNGQPVEGALLAAAALESATETDAFSTALLIGGRAEFQSIAGARSDMRALLLTNEGGGHVVETKGLTLLKPTAPHKEHASTPGLRLLTEGCI